MKLDRTLIERSPLTESQKKLLISIDVEGHGVVEVARLSGKGKSTVSIGHSRALKKFNAWLSEIDRASGTRRGGKEALREIHYTEELGALGVPLDRLPAFVALVEKYGPKAGEALEHAVKLKEIEEKEGKTYQAVLVEFSEKSAAAKEMGGEVERLRKERKSLQESLGELHTMVPLKEELDRHNLSGHRLQAFIDRNLKLDEIGFSSHAAEVLGSELQKRGLDPSKAAALLASMIEEYGSIEGTLSALKGQKRTLEKKVETATDALDTAKQEIGGIEEQINVKRAQLEQWKQLVAGQERLHQSELKRREVEIGDLEDRKEVLRKGNEELEIERGAIRSAISELEGNLKKIEVLVDKTKPLAVMASVAENPKSPLPSSDVAETLLGIIAGFRLYSDANPRDLFPETRKLLGELQGMLSKEVRIAGHQSQ
jgi:hypothetical protein